MADIDRHIHRPPAMTARAPMIEKVIAIISDS